MAPEIASSKPWFEPWLYNAPAGVPFLSCTALLIPSLSSPSLPLHDIAKDNMLLNRVKKKEVISEMPLKQLSNHQERKLRDILPNTKTCMSSILVTPFFIWNIVISFTKHILYRETVRKVTISVEGSNACLQWLIVVVKSFTWRIVRELNPSNTYISSTVQVQPVQYGTIRHGRGIKYFLYTNIS